ncbi:MAG: putative ABC transporter permease [Lachnospiraceae bacterium]|nr:putative ABC transporter permease [Lachnospiraceae bacterium]
MSLKLLLFLFFIFCLIGWVWESIYESIRNHKLLNRGFLNGPYIPIYGCGGMLIFLTMQRFQAPFFSKTTLIAYFIGAIGLTTIEYITSYALEKILKARWWDYSDYPLNINGRICLIASVFWGFVTLFGIDLLNPFLLKLYERIPSDVSLVYVSVMTTLFILDIFVTINSIIDLKNRIQIMLSMEKEKVTSAFAGSAEFFRTQKARLSHIGNPFTKRIVNAFPNLRFKSEKVQNVFVKIKGFMKGKDNE